MIELILIYPILAGFLLYFFQNKRLNIIASLLYSCLLLLSVGIIYFYPKAEFLNINFIFNISLYFNVDELNFVFLIVLALLYFGVSLYNIKFLVTIKLSSKSHTLYTIFLLLFIFSMTGSILSMNLAVLWIFIEATTLTSAYLIFFNHTKSALEAAWKYLFICSIGIALAFVGIIFLSIGSGSLNLLFFSDLYNNAKKISPHWLKLSLTFIIFGFGTKAGLAPVHAWLPDAHSESPSPVSALLSGTLLNTALIGIFRVMKISKLAGIGSFTQNILLIMGFLSIFVCAVFIIRSANYKRMLAYSSIENIGIIAIGAALGGIAALGAVIHIVAHSLIKAAFFLTSGNILHTFRTKEISDVKGLLKTDNVSGWLWIFSFVFIVGIPPSPIFFSEFLIVKQMLQLNHVVISIIFLLLLTIIIFGMGNSVFRMAFGKAEKEQTNKNLHILYYISPAVLLLLCLLLGIYIPKFLYNILQISADMI